MFGVLTLAWATAPVDLSGARDIRVRVTNTPILLPVPSIGELDGFRLLRPLGLPGSFGTVFEAERDGAVEIRRRDGTVFRILPLRTAAASPLDVKGVKVKVSAGDLVAIVRQGRERG